jgi:hypothetical protein
MSRPGWTATSELIAALRTRPEITSWLKGDRDRELTLPACLRIAHENGERGALAPCLEGRYLQVPRLHDATTAKAKGRAIGARLSRGAMGSAGMNA